jgi:cytochrome P450
MLTELLLQAGPRMCLGKDASYLQMKMCAALLLRFFRFELVSGHQVMYRMMPVMLMKHGLKVNVIARFRV